MVLKLGTTTGEIEASNVKTTTLVNANGETFGEWNLIEYTTVSSSKASHEIDISGSEYSAWDDIKIVGRNLSPVSDNVNLNFYVSTDSGSTYKSSYKDLIWRSNAEVTTVETFAYAPTRSASELLQGVGNDAWSNNNVEVTMFTPFHGLADVTWLSVGCSWYQTGAAFNYAIGGAHCAVSSLDVTTVKFSWASGNIDQGDFASYGRKTTA